MGEVSVLVKTPYGYHIIKVEDKKGLRQETLNEAGEEIRSVLMAQKKEKSFQGWIAGLRQKGTIELKIK